jgi:hypothetical protein
MRRGRALAPGRACPMAIMPSRYYLSIWHHPVIEIDRHSTPHEPFAGSLESTYPHSLSRVKDAEGCHGSRGQKPALLACLTKVLQMKCKSIQAAPGGVVQALPLARFAEGTKGPFPKTPNPIRPS